MTFEFGKAQLALALRSAGVMDTGVMAAIESIPRHLFVPNALKKFSYEDTTLPIGYQQTLSQPSIVGIMTEALSLTDRVKVLEVGTGSGYQTSILAQLSRRVYTIERYRPLLELAEQRFQALRLNNITVKYGDGTLGWKQQMPFDRIIVAAAAQDVPPLLADQLSVGGIMVVPIEDAKNFQTILKIQRQDDGFSTDELRSVNFVPLVPDIAAVVP